MIVNYDKDNGFSTFLAHVEKKIPSASEEATKFFDNTKNWNLNAFANSKNGIDDLIDKFNLSDESLKKFLKTTDASKISLSNYQSYLESTAKSGSRFATAMDSAKAGLKNLGGIAVSFLANAAVSAGIALIGAGILTDNLKI